MMINIFQTTKNFIAQLRTLNRSARLFLLASVMYGIVLNGWNLFFNFYILEHGFSREFLGLANAAPFMAALLSGIPLGMLSDRIGQKRSIIVGVVAASLCQGVLVLVSNSNLILVMAFLYGAATALYFLSQAPFIMTLSDEHNRTLLFSLHFGLLAFSGVIGNILAGYLPTFFHNMWGILPHTVFMYRAVLLTLIGISFLAIPPLWLIHKSGAIQGETTTKSSFVSPPVWQILRHPLTIKFSVPGLLIGFGAGLIVPYFNIFFAERFALADQQLGFLFSAASFIMAISSVALPYLAEKLGGKIHAVVVMQTSSILFLLGVGFSPYLWVAVGSFLMRWALMRIPFLKLIFMFMYRTEQPPRTDLRLV